MLADRLRAIATRVRVRLGAEAHAQREVARSAAGRTVLAALGVIAVLTVVGLVVLWPGEIEFRPDEQNIVSTGIVEAQVIAVSTGDCPVESNPGCVRVDFELQEGPAAGRASFLILPGDEASPEVQPGDTLRVAPNADSFSEVPVDPGLDADPALAPYGFVDFERRSPMLWLALGFVALVVFLGRRVGTLSLIGVVIGLLLVTTFVVPAILDGSSPMIVALVGSFAAMFATIVLVYGLGAKSLAALLGTAASLLTTALLAVVFVKAAHITGTGAEDATLVRGLGDVGRLSLEGLVLAGIMIGALGVLNDVTVGQAATVLALRKANPTQSLRDLYRAGVEVGRDHLGATVNTLVFAYAGASLPLLLIFSSQGIGFGEAVNREIVATEIVAALVGSIGLIAAVPLTTATAALLAVQLPAAALPEDSHHGHAH